LNETNPEINIINSGSNDKTQLLINSLVQLALYIIFILKFIYASKWTINRATKSITRSLSDSGLGPRSLPEIPKINENGSRESPPPARNSRESKPIEVAGMEEQEGIRRRDQEDRKLEQEKDPPG